MKMKIMECTRNSIWKGTSKSLDRCLFITIIDLFLITLIVILIQSTSVRYYMINLCYLNFPDINYNWQFIVPSAGNITQYYLSAHRRFFSSKDLRTIDPPLRENTVSLPEKEWFGPLIGISGFCPNSCRQTLRSRAN